MRKIQISESKLYEIIKRVLIEQEQEKEVWITDEHEFKSRLYDVFDRNSEKFSKVHNKHYGKIVVNGDLNLSYIPITSLPDNLHVKGSLNLSDTPIKSLPDNLHVGGGLFLGGTKITSLPDNLHVGGNLSLSNTPITSLPDNLYVEGYLDLANTPITSLPDNLHVGGTLFLSVCKNLTSLPDNLHVWGRLYLERTPIKSLPNNLQVSKSLILISSKIETLPDNLKVGCCIYIHNTPLSKNNELIKKYADEGHIIITEPVTYSEIIQDEKEIDEYKKFEFELGEQSTDGAKTAYPAVTKWDSGVKRGSANPIDPKQKWSDIYQTKRGKANTIDSKSKWSTGLTRGKANTLL